jgi:phosphodiesterase/alkaline phosphatase D-like protein
MRELRVVSSGAVARGFTRSLVLALVALTGVLAFSTAPALAATGHKFLSSISEAPPGTPLNNSEAVTIDPTTGNVFVVAGEDGIDVFNSAGVFQTKFGSGVLEGESLGIAVDRSGRVYVADLGTNTLDVFKPNGSGGYELLSQWSGANTPATEFSELGGVAVDNSTSKSDPSAGEVYVLDKGASAVYVFKPKEGPEEASEGSLLTILSGGKPELEELGGVAVNSATGQVYLAGTKEGETGFVEVFNSAHVFESKLAGKGAVTGGLGPLGAVAVREATGEVYVVDTEAGAIDQLNPAGEWMGWVQAGPDGQNLAALGVAVAAGGQLYVSSGLVDVFGPNVTVPDLKTGSGKSSKTKPVVVTLSGTINPLGNAKYHFEYGQEGRFTGTTPVVEASGSAELKVTAAVEGLKPGELYNFRLVAESEEKVTTYGQTVFFLTAEAVAGVATGPALNVTPTSATLTGSLEPQKFVTKYYFEWGETSSYGHNSPVPFGVTSATGVVPVETNLTGLKTSTTYHYRLVASNQFGISYGGDASFSTSGPGITIQPAAPIGHTTATLNAKVNPNKLETKYHFEYGETAAYGTSTKEEVLAAGIEKPEPVKAELTGLKLATTYHFRVVATNAAGTVNGPDQEFTTVLIENESATALTGETALLQAEVNPLGVSTSCQFEYGTSPSYGSTVPCEPTPGSSATPVLVSGHVKGLTPNTTYHYRVTATVEGIAEKGNGPDQEFTTPASGASFKLPDGRAYEMVSPPNKQGGFIQPITAAGGVIQASEDGNALAYIANGPVREDVEGNRAPESQQILATRGSTAWSSQEIVPPHERPAGLRVGQAFDEYLLFSGDLSLGAVQPFSFALTPFAEPPLSPPMAEAERKPCPESTSVRPCQEKTMYLRNNAPIPPASETAEETIYNEARQNGETLAKEHGEAGAKPGYLPLVSAANVAPGAKFGGTPINQTSVNPSLEFLDATQDLSHVVFLGKVALAPQPPSAAGLYEWGANKLQLVSVLPNGEPAPGATVSLGFSFQNNGRGANYRHAISDDGSRIVWTSEETNHLGHLYVRDTAKAQTLQLDTVEAGLPTPEKGEAFFQIASADGSRVFFTDSQRLTAGSTAGLAKPDLYECEVTEVAGKLACKGGVVDLTVDHNAGESAAVQRLVLGASEDGSYVYFVATGVLAGSAQAGANNLYVLHYDGTKWTTSFIARLSSEDAPDWSSRSNANEQLLTNMTSRVSPNGTYLAFMSNRSLTGYNNIDVNEETGKHADEEVFLYSAGSQSLTCASCNPTGARPRGVFDTEFAGEGSGLVVDKPQTWMFGPGGFNVGTAHWLAGSIPGWTTLTILRGIYQSRYLSDSGRLFFNSADALVPEAAGATRTETIEGKEATVGVENVYEYQPNEVGSCRAGTGCVSLISSASSGKESAFLDASANGNDVYFLTAATLLPQDEDSSYDVYDARVCGESGCQPTPEKPPPPCGNIPECRGGSSGAPTFAPPPGFSGPGNTLHKVGTGETLPSKAKKPPLTRAQKLALALKSCRKLAHKTRAQKKKRAKCESVARKKYGPKKAAKHAKRSSSAGRGR